MTRHQQQHERRQRVLRKLASLHRHTWRQTTGYHWILWLLDNEWRYT